MAKDEKRTSNDDWRGSTIETGDIPMAYLITFTTYGTWLHGDARGSVDRNHNEFGAPLLDENLRRADFERRQSSQNSLKLGAESRTAVHATIVEVCEYRGWTLRALNVRTNHVHVVATAPVRPEALLHDFKAYATRRLRREKLIELTISPWTAGGSTRYLWKPNQVDAACRYVDNGQGPDI